MAQFQTFTSSVDISFWSELCNRKLEKIQLNEAPISITGCYRIQLTTSQKTSNLDFPALFLLERNSFDETLDEQKYTTHSPGTLFLTNTVEGFKELDKKSLFNQASGQVFFLFFFFFSSIQFHKMLKIILQQRFGKIFLMEVL